MIPAPPLPEREYPVPDDLAYPNATIIIRHKSITNTFDASQRSGSAVFSSGPGIGWANSPSGGLGDTYTFVIKRGGDAPDTITVTYAGKPVSVWENNSFSIQVK